MQLYGETPDMSWWTRKDGIMLQCNKHTGQWQKQIPQISDGVFTGLYWGNVSPSELNEINHYLYGTPLKQNQNNMTEQELEHYFKVTGNDQILKEHTLTALKSMYHMLYRTNPLTGYNKTDLIKKIKWYFRNKQRSAAFNRMK